MEYLLPLSLAAIVFNFRVALALATGVWQGYVGIPALTFLALAGLIALLRFRYHSHKNVAIACEVLLVIGSVMLFKHWAPGFSLPKILNEVQAGPHSQPFTLYYGLDKALIPFLLLGCLPSLFATSAQPNVAPWRWVLLLLCVPGLLLLAMVLGGLAPVWLGNFMLANLFFVSLAEEALFRGYIQRRLGQLTGGLPSLLHYRAVVWIGPFAVRPINGDFRCPGRPGIRSGLEMERQIVGGGGGTFCPEYASSAVFHLPCLAALTDRVVRPMFPARPVRERRAISPGVSGAARIASA